jgi:hypothetical protein
MSSSPNDLYQYNAVLHKLHSIIQYIRITPQRRQLYISDQAASLEASPDFMVIANNATRWNSTYKMLKAALVLRP